MVTIRNKTTEGGYASPRKYDVKKADHYISDRPLNDFGGYAYFLQFYLFKVSARPALQSRR